MKIKFLIFAAVVLAFSGGFAKADPFGNDANPPLAAPQISPSAPESPTSPISPVSGTSRGFVEVGGDYSGLNHNYKDLWGAYLRSAFRSDAKNTWNLEVDQQQEYGNNGTFESLGNTHIWTDRFFTSLSMGTSEGGKLFLPDYRVDGFLYYKFLPDKSLVGNFGLGYYDSKLKNNVADQRYHDESVNFGASYYFPGPWILEGGVHLDFSDPGGVFAPMAFAALTWGHNKRDFVTLRYAYGKEAYTEVFTPLNGTASFNTDVGFYTNEVDVIWRHWFNHGPWGFNARGEYYASSAYDRIGGTFGIFREF